MSSQGARAHDLDALRAVAMSLGIVLHSIVQFVPYRPAGDTADTVMSDIVDVLHGFRMPLFFLLSGYFMAMLISRRGLVRSMGQRATRIGVPFAIAVLTIIPLLEWVGEKVYTWIIREGRFDVSAVANTTGDSGGIGLAHLWFLWFLLIYIAVLMVLVLIARTARRIWPRVVVPGWLGTVTITVLTVVPCVTEATARSTEFGPPTDNSWTPGMGILVYYLAFYCVGALLYVRPFAVPGSAIYGLSKWWPLLLMVGVGVLYPLGVSTTSLTVVSAVAQVAYAWTMVFGLIGLFKTVFAKERFWVRYASDSSYWLYLVHLPVVFVFQGVFAFTDWPGAVEAVLVATLTVLSMLIVYAVAVRYTPLGWLLNGRRTLSGDMRALRGSSVARAAVEDTSATVVDS